MPEDDLNSFISKNDPELLCINNFPNEILEEILSRLLSESDLCNAKLVCRRWRFIVDEMVGHEIIVTNYTNISRYVSCEEGRPLSLPRSVKDVESLDTYPNLAIRHLKIGVPGMLTNDSLTVMIERISKQILDFPVTHYPFVLKRLECYEPLPQNIFHALSPMGNLTYLNMSLFSLSNIIKETSFQICTFRYLTTLLISETPAYPEFNSSSAILPLNNFLKCIYAPKLTQLGVTCPIISLLDIEEDSTRFVIDLIKKSTELKKLSITVCSPNQNFSPPARGFQYPSSLMTEMETLGKRIQLESVELKDNHLHSLRPSVQTKAWIVLIKQQISLNFLKFLLKSSIEFVEDVVQILQNNQKTLKTLDLSCFPCEITEFGEVHFVPFDGHTLAKCCSLKTLRLSDKTINTMDLPASLSYVYVDAMLTNTDAHNILMSKSPSLKRIDLKDTRGGAPKGFGYGVTNATLLQFIQKRTVQRLVIYAGSTNDKFPHKGFANGDTDFPVQLRKQNASPTAILYNSPSQENLARIDWQLNERGFYENTNQQYNTHQFDTKNEDPLNVRHPLYKCNTLFSTFH